VLLSQPWDKLVEKVFGNPSISVGASVVTPVGIVSGNELVT